MHMADALISPEVGAGFGAASAAVGGLAARRLRKNLDEGLIPLMGVLGAFVFAAQMINFAIPGTGSSGHLSGGLLLAILLGPQAAFITMASILTVQALFFADGGLLALGANIWNLAFYSSFLVYPFIFRPLAGRGSPSSGRLFAASLVAALAAAQLGAFSVVMQTVLSGRSELPFGAFALLMQPVHLVIGLAEGFATAGIVRFIANARPEILCPQVTPKTLPSAFSARKIVVFIAIVALFTGGILSWFTSVRPDGLDWSIARLTGEKELAAEGKFALAAGKIQEKTAFLPDYTWRPSAGEKPEQGSTSWPRVDQGTSLAGVTGALLVALIIGVVGLALRAARRKYPLKS